MTRYLSLAEVLKLHSLIIAESGGSAGLRDLGMLESALGQPRQTFDGKDLYRSFPSKAEAVLMLNGLELAAGVDEAEAEILAVAAGRRTREEFQDWIEKHVRPIR